VLVEAARLKDREAFEPHLHPDFEFHDYRSTIAGFYDDDKGTSMLAVFDLDIVRWDSQLVAAAGDRLALYRSTLRATSRQVGEAEWDAYTLDEIAADGRLVRVTGFNADALDQAMTVFKARAEELEHDPLAIPRNVAVRRVARPEWRLVAALGDLLCEHATSDGFVVHEVDAAGNVVAIVHFGMHERAAAANEIAQRFHRLHGIGPADALGPMNAHDLDAVRAAMADGLVFEDHRTFRLFDLGGPDEHRQLLAGTFELTTDHITEFVRSDALEPWGQVALLRMSGTTQDGGPFEDVCIAVTVWGDGGLVTHIAIYDPGDVDTAVAHLQRFAPDETDPFAIPRNLAVGAVEQPGWMLIAALEEDLCMHATPDGFVIHEVDEAGKVIAKIEYGIDERRAAADELASRFYAHHDSLAGNSLSAAMNARDVEGMRAALSGSAVFEDHRRMRMIEGATGADYVSMVEPVMELAPDYLIEVLRSYAVHPWGQALLCRMSGTTADGGPFENVCIGVSLFGADGLVSNIAIYDPDDVEAALTHLRDADPGRNGS
jgi:hypothetical protein